MSDCILTYFMTVCISAPLAIRLASYMVVTLKIVTLITVDRNCVVYSCMPPPEISMSMLQMVFRTTVWKIVNIENKMLEFEKSC